MAKNDKYNMPESNSQGDVMPWVVIFILLVVFWPVGLIMLLRKLRIFEKPQKDKKKKKKKKKQNKAKSQNTAARFDISYDYTTNTDDAMRDAEDAAEDAEHAAREITAEISQAAQEVRTAVRQALSEIQAGISRDISQSAASKARNSASFQSQSWQELSKKPGTWQYTVAQSLSEYSKAKGTPASQVKNSSSTGAGTTVSDQADSDGTKITASVTSEPGSSSSGKNTEIKKERSALDKRSGRFVYVVLLLISIALFILGANKLTGAIPDLWVGISESWFDFGVGVFYLAGGLFSFLLRNISVRRLARFKRYNLIVSGKDMISLTDISQISGISARTVKRDIQAMIDAGYLGRNSYINHSLNSLVLSLEAVEDTLRSSETVAEDTPPVADTKTANQYMAIILELRALNDSIIDAAISEKIDRIEEVTAMIFRIVEDNPEKLPQIRRFMNYYLPTTIKLLGSYATLEKQGITGENISAAKENISRVLEMLATGFEQQLDQLFMSDALDIAADINVLENLMQQDGLTASAPELRMMEGV